LSRRTPIRTAHYPSHKAKAIATITARALNSMVSPSLVDSVTRVGDRSPAGHPQASGSFGFGPLTAHPQPSSSFASELPLHPAAMHGHAASPSFSPSLSFAHPSPSARVKRLAFLSPQAESHRTPYLWDLYETPAAPAQKHQPNTRSVDLDLQHRFDDFHAAFPAQPMDKGTGMGVGSLELPPLERATTEQFQAVFSPAHAHYYSHHAGPVSDLSLHAEATGEPAVSECDRCWLEAAQCAACREAKQAQFLNGWPVDVDAHHYHNSDVNHALLEHANAHNHEMTPLLQPAQPHYSFESDAIPMPPIQSELPARSFEEEKTAAMPLPPMVAAPAPGVGQGYEALARVQGKLARFLGPDGDGEGESDGGVCPPLELPSPMLTSVVAPSVGGRSMRVRKIRSRSPSLELSDSEDSGRSTPTHFHADSDLDDSISPPPAANAVPATHARNAMVEGSDDSGQSSAEPPLPTSLLPVSASALLPSRPSTAAIPPAHIKDRLVKSAKKLLTAADGVDTAVQVQVIPIFFPSKGASGAHKIRLIRVFNTDTQRVSVYAHAADVGGVVERKSNISRLFGKFESPSEKLLMNVVSVPFFSPFFRHFFASFTQSQATQSSSLHAHEAELVRQSKCCDWRKDLGPAALVLILLLLSCVLFFFLSVLFFFFLSVVLTITPLVRRATF
jgi:hypothetical protein